MKLSIKCCAGSASVSSCGTGDMGQRWTDVAAAVTQTHLTWAGDIIHMLSCTEIMLDAGVDAPVTY